MKTKKINICENTLAPDGIEPERDEPVFWTTKDGNVWQKAQFGMLPIGAKYILEDDLNDKVRTDSDRLKFLLHISFPDVDSFINQYDSFGTQIEALDYLMDQEELNG